jgi:hypothetical protein
MCARSIVFSFSTFLCFARFPFFSFTQSQLCAYACGLAVFVYWDDFRGLPWARFLPETGDANYVEYHLHLALGICTFFILIFLMISKKIKMKIQNHLKINKNVPVATNHVVSTKISIKNILYFRRSKKDKFSKKN